MNMNKVFYTAVEERRSIYALGKNVKLEDDEIRGIVEHAVIHAPSAFNSQSARVLLYLASLMISYGILQWKP